MERADLARIVAVAGGAVAQVVCGPIGTALPGARDQAAISDANANVLTPAGWAFAIWGLIFAGCLALAVYQALPSQHDAEIHRRTGWPLAVALWGNAVWELVFPQEGLALVAAQVIIVGIVAAAAVAVGRGEAVETTGLQRVLPRGVAALLLGWVSLATVAGTVLTAVSLGAPTDGAVAVATGVPVLVITAAILLDVTMRLGWTAVPFAAAGCWGLLGIALNEPPLPIRLAAFAAIAIVLAGLVAQSWRNYRLERVLVG